LREQCKKAENAYTFETRDAQNTAYTTVFESNAKNNTINYSILGGAKMLVFTQSQENIEGTGHCK